jgi:hypothetical protein
MSRPFLACWISLNDPQIPPDENFRISSDSFLVSFGTMWLKVGTERRFGREWVPGVFGGI